MILGVQIIGIGFGLIMSYFIFSQRQKGSISRIQYIFWQVVWIGFIVIAIFPSLTQGFLHKLGFIRTLDFLTMAGFMFLIFLVLRNYIAINKIKKNLEEKIREESLNDLNKNENSSA